ncbi:MAG: hypothetical protein COU81_00990 [Candidatus Portnoybacteria bacterium CG10_big_fil_rev_8_21_14_0_10_36_7]|uniref:Glycosyl transferase family 1 domain-containing protein n=1 Tax=Candidatus Portnoybacteria bacterium CG10_big_fil_rev_8_21_14_0_10_36_7 TaxID=1974812 RepID=A0A2M8KEQ9_9BACT|nr:MAG: hypothetical protein COU81_00990 [Candidatus Portnoybacteria bacterium CG10_big_fil_rev_8_21_14_0_10_36_7]
MRNMNILVTFPIGLTKNKKVVTGGISRQIKDFYGYVAKEPDTHMYGLVIRFKPGLSATFNKRAVKKTAPLGFQYYYIQGDSTKLYNSIKKIDSLEDISVSRLSEAIIKRIIEIIERDKVEVVLINGMPSWHVWFVREAARRVGIPLVMVHAGVMNREVHMYRNVIDKKIAQIYSWIEKDYCGGDIWNIFLNETTRDFLRENVFGRKEFHGKVIYLPLAEAYTRVKAKVNSTSEQKASIKVGTVGRWDRIKNHPAILKLAEYAQAHSLPIKYYSVTMIPNTQINFKMKEKYRKVVNVFGQMSSSELIKYYKELDLLIMPSFFDVSPNTVLESMIVGTPALISPNVGHVEWYRKTGISKWIIDFKNIKQTTDMIIEVANQNVPKEVTAWIKKNHRANKAFKEYLSVAKEAIAEYSKK